MAEPPGCVDARREPEADLSGVDRRGIDARDAHQRLQPGLLCARERAEAGDRQRAVLAEQRDDVGDRRERDEIELTAQDVGVGAEQRLAELERHARAAELLRRHHRTVGQLFAGTVMVGDDDVEPELPRAPNLIDGGDAAVDREHEPAAFPGEALERVAADAVALVEAARQMPLHDAAEGTQDTDGDHCRADAVDVVVAVHADPLTGRDRRANPLDRGGHVSKLERIPQRLLAGEERARRVGVAVAAPDEHACRDLAEAELTGERVGLPVRARTDRPGALRHRRLR